MFTRGSFFVSKQRKITPFVLCYTKNIEKHEKEGQLLEDVMEQRIVENLGYMYGKENSDQILMIFFLRSMIFYNKTNIRDSQYLDFLIEELNLPQTDIFKLNGVEISKSSYLRPFSLANIMDSYIYCYLEVMVKDEIGEIVPRKQILKKIFLRFKETVDKEYKYERKSSLYYQERYRYSMLKELYKEFSIVINGPKRIEGLDYPPNHNDLKLTIDEKLQRYYLLYHHQNKKLTEEELESYIYFHPEVIGDFKNLYRQHKVPSGIIDLFGEDKNGNKVVIELKIKKRPKDLIWQLKAYTEDVKKIYKGNVRTIAITPPLDESILSQLKNIDCELIYFYKRNNRLIFEKQVI